MRTLTALVVGLAIIGYMAGVVQADEHRRWQALKNNPSCVVWNGDPQEQETVTWTGSCVSGKAQGRGVQVWRYWKDDEWEGGRYEGDMKGGKLEGRGTYSYISGNRYEGD